MAEAVLVIEDDAKLGAQVVEHLRRAGFAATWWRDGRAIVDGERPEAALGPGARHGPRVGALRLDTETREVTFEGRPVDLTRVEFDLLAALARRPHHPRRHPPPGGGDGGPRPRGTEAGGRGAREQALRAFLANATHDVMIPLTVLQGHLVEAQGQLAAGQPVSRSLLVEAQGEAHYLGGLMHDLATTARLDSAEPRLQIERVELEGLVARVMGRHRPIARELGVEIESANPAEPVAAFADLTLLEQAVSNLVYNAICHNHAGGHAALIVDTVYPAVGAERFRLRVIDDGPGIPEDELARLSARGFRGNEARTRVPGGQGLGLDIAHRVAKVHDFGLVLRRSEYGGLEAELTGPLA